MAIVNLKSKGVKEMVGIEVHITKPIKKSYQIETTDKEQAVGIALDFAQLRNPNNDWKNVEYSTNEYKYKDLAY